jgi:hypothetical protein
MAKLQGLQAWEPLHNEIVLRRLISTTLEGCRYYLPDDPGRATSSESTKLAGYSSVGRQNLLFKFPVA